MTPPCSTSGLPDEDGLALLETLRQRPERPPVLVLTARDSVEDQVNGLDAGADDYLVKTVRHGRAGGAAQGAAAPPRQRPSASG
ncbi:response regulator [Phenylobacterium sp. J367]|uniref:response regulator n=1 Tax=Phenylobacterium sp. J367 TaxID=2898435 RepID=UPI0027E25316|nr:response regulator [Phenylobacterium sp. J367]